jgi:pseudouridine-5'-phosphate glycosidase
MAMDADEVTAAAYEAEVRADRAGAHGKARTPFLLAALAELTDGRSLEANLALLEDNARVAAEIAVAAAP